MARIEFIRTIEGYEKINPYLDLRQIAKIKELLCQAGLYNTPIGYVKDCSIINLLLKAQSKKPIRTTKTREVTKDQRKKIYDYD